MFEKLKLVARCDVEGPIFEEHDIMLAIELCTLLAIL
jgi:hypothetical protein